MATLLLRLMLCIWLFVHGAGKLFGWFGGMGLQPTVDMMSKTYPTWLVYLSVLAESIGALLIGIGLITRLAALTVFINMVVASFAMWSMGFFKVEDPVALCFIALAILVMGPGAFSIDAALFNRPKLGTTILK